MGDPGAKPRKSRVPAYEYVRPRRDFELGFRELGCTSPASCSAIQTEFISPVSGMRAEMLAFAYRSRDLQLCVYSEVRGPGRTSRQSSVFASSCMREQPPTTLNAPRQDSINSVAPVRPRNRKMLAPRAHGQLRVHTSTNTRVLAAGRPACRATHCIRSESPAPTSGNLQWLASTHQTTRQRLRIRLQRSTACDVCIHEHTPITTAPVARYANGRFPNVCVCILATLDVVPRVRPRRAFRGY